MFPCMKSSIPEFLEFFYSSAQLIGNRTSCHNSGLDVLVILFKITRLITP